MGVKSHLGVSMGVKSHLQVFLPGWARRPTLQQRRPRVLGVPLVHVLPGLQLHYLGP